MNFGSTRYGLRRYAVRVGLSWVLRRRVLQGNFRKFLNIFFGNLVTISEVTTFPMLWRKG